MNTKTFKYKGQMVNYLNKVRQNKNIDFYVCGFSVEKGFYLSYTTCEKLKKLLTNDIESVIINI